MSEEKTTVNTNYASITITAIIFVVLLVGGYLFYIEYNRSQEKDQETVTKCREVSKHRVSRANGNSFVWTKEQTYSTVEEYDEDIYSRCLRDAGVNK